ncbi:MAG: LPS assembly lipoprotein LptE [Deltaproteobacteria bacterium]|nr:LPS assembly lipoprotein LptE [Deltaproteobacteria bacterium]
MACLISAGLVAVSLPGCGYSLNSSPYRLDLRGQTLRLAVPVAENHSRFGRLGPELTEAVIERLSGTEGLFLDTVNPEATLKLTITSVAVGSGSWEPVQTTSREIPEASSSRTAGVSVMATLTRPNPDGGAPLVKTSQFYNYRTYLVSRDQGQVEMQEAEALDWVIDDISQKIGAIMFNEF